MPSDIRDGCTVVSFMAKFIKRTLVEEPCCEEHDLFYEQGGGIGQKYRADIQFAKCVVRAHGGSVKGYAKAVLGFIVVSLNPYAFIAWNFKGESR